MSEDCRKNDKRMMWRLNYSDIIVTIILAIVGWGALQIWAMKSVTDQSAAIHAKIPDGFFTKDRYGADDAEKHRQDDERKRHELELRITYLEKLSAGHLQEAEIWKTMIKELAASIRQLEKIMWRNPDLNIDK